MHLRRSPIIGGFDNNTGEATIDKKWDQLIDSEEDHNCKRNRREKGEEGRMRIPVVY